MNKIGTVTESSLHAALKKICAFPEDRIEEPVMGYMVDILRPDEIVEIQTGNFVALRPKLANLLQSYKVRVVMPIALKRHIIRIDKDGAVISRRLSPKRGRIEDLFVELVWISGLLSHPNLIIEAALVEDEIYWIDDGKGSWRRKNWSVKDRVLVNYIGAHILSGVEEFAKLIPINLSEKFTSRQFSQELKLPMRQASKMLYCLRAIYLLEVVGRQGHAYLYQRYTGST